MNCVPRGRSIGSWKYVLGLIAATLALATAAYAAQVGDIQVCYNCSNNFGQGVLDGPFFVIENTSGKDITNGVLSIGTGGHFTDSFKVGTVLAGKRVFVLPGISDDGGTGHTFFAHTGSLLDTSESGPSADDTQFEFIGQQAGFVVDSGVFTPAATRGPTNDHTVSDMNFLGGPGNNDGACNDCFGPKVVATLNISLLCDIQLNKTTFVTGDQVIAQVARLANPDPNPVPVEVKLWFDVPGSPPVPFLTVGADGSFVLSPGFDKDFGPLALATVQASFPRGSYSFNCRLLHAVTGALLSEDFNPFQLQ